MSDEEIELLDQYILASDKEKFLSSLVHAPGTFNSLRLLDHVNRYGFDLPQDSKVALEKASNNPSASKTQASFVYQLLRIENETDEATRTSLMLNFNKRYLRETFSISRPSAVDQSTAWLAKKELSCPSEVVCDRYSFEECEKSLFGQQDRCVKDIKQQYYYRFDLQKLQAALQRDLSDFQWVLDSLPSFTHVPSIGEVLVEYEAKAKKFHKSDSFTLEITESTYEKMTLAQMEEVQQALPRVIHDRYFVASKFRKTFEQELFDLHNDRGPCALEDLEKHFQRLKKMYDWLRDLPQSHPYMSFAAQILRTMLELDLKRNTVDEVLFKEYLSNPLRYDQILYGVRETGGSNADSNMKGVEDAFWHGVHNLNIRQWLTEEKFVTQVLTVLFLRGVEYSSYSVYFERAFLQELYYKTQILAGKPVENAMELLGDSVLAALRSKKRLRFAACNKTRFQPGESIHFKLEVKNISSVSVSIFEIDTESYYRKNMTEVNEHIDLAGLIPSKRFERALTADPMVLQIIDFEDLFVADRGVFVIDFVGDELSSRALIRAGALTVVTQTLSKGILLHLVDEQKHICHKNDTSVIIDNRVIKPAEMLHNGILVPFGEKPRTETVVLRYKGFAELHSLYIPGEEVVLKCALLLNEETVKRGGRVELVLLPRVTVNNLKVKLVSLKNIKVTITATNTAGVNSLTTYEDVTVERTEKGIVLEYYAKPKTERLTMQMTAKFFSIAKGKSIDLSCEECIVVNRFIGKNLFYDLYLSPFRERDLKLHFLGKNGEPYAHKRVGIHLQSFYLTEEQSKSETLQTNDKGEILLVNAIPYISDLRAEILDTPSSIERKIECNLTNTDHITSLRQTRSALENEQVSFPAAARHFVASAYELLKVSRESFGCIISDHSAQIVYKEGMLDLIGLTEGVYRFTYRDYGVNILITVHSGKRWAPATQQYVEKEDSIVRLSDCGPCLSYKNFKAHNSRVEFDVVSSDMNTVEVHAFAFTYFPRTLPMIKEAFEKLRCNEEYGEYKIRENTCVYLSEKKLSDELKYVLERKKKRNIVGSTLEKPPGLLGRHFVCETHEDDEVLREGEDYKGLTQPGLMKACGMSRPTRYAYNLAAYSRGVDAVDPPPPAAYTVDCLSGFLPAAGWSRLGAVPDAAGRVCLEVPPGRGYTTLVVVLRDHTGGLVEWVPLLAGERPAFCDVRLAQSKKSGVVYVQKRQAQRLEKGGMVEITDPDATEFNVVDNIATLFSLIRLINPDPAMREWEFLTKWHTMKPREQLVKYDKYACHELNLFIYFKDPEFFTAVVRPHLRCKSKKQFIDYFLLGDVNHLVTYLSPARLDLLSLLERALLVRFFAKQRSDECKAIALDIVHLFESQESNQKHFERLFDTVVTGGIATEEERTAESISMDPNQTKNETGEAKIEAQSRGLHDSSLMRPIAMRCMRASNDLLSGSVDPRNMVIDTEGYERALKSTEDELAARVVKYRNVGTTNEYVEKQYFEADTFNAQPNAFWVDVLQHFTTSASGSFLTENFMYATGSLTEMLLVLALIDVPFKKGFHQSDVSGQPQQLVVSSNAIIFTKTIQTETNEKLDFDLLMTQKFCDPSDLYTFSSDGTKTLKNVEEFLSGKLYVSKVVLTNASEYILPLCVVHEVPQGAIPVGSPEYTQYINLHMEPLTTQMLEFFFYFPQTGEFTCYPVTANRDGYFINKATIKSTLKVFHCQTVVKRDTISNVISNGSKADILSFMETNNLHQADRFEFQAIYWLLNDKQFYTDVLALLRRKHIFEEKVWGFSIKHGDFIAFTEYVQHYLNKYDFGLAATDGIEGSLLYLSTKTIHVDRYEYKEYYPLIVSRVHEVGRFRHNIRNQEFKQSYWRFLRYLSQKSPNLTTRDYIYLCTYLLLQERLDDCLFIYRAITQPQTGDHGSEDQEELQIQFDYLTAYLDQYIDYPAFRRAREICTKYLTYPVFNWRNRFIKLLNQISEVDGGAAQLPTQGDTNTDGELSQIQAEIEPHLAAVLHLDDSSVKLTVRNIKEFTVSFYRIDIEVLFSQNPFLSMNSIDYSYVQANKVHTQLMPEPLQVMATESVPIPHDLKGSNLVIRVKADQHVINLTYFPKAMAVVVNRNSGLVRVLAEGSYKPLSGVYVKAFAKKNDDKVIFFKDGYTDLRGSFEYASVHTNKLDELKEFSLLILSTEFGGRIERVGPPSAVAAVELGTAKIVSGDYQALYRKKVHEASNKYCV